MSGVTFTWLGQAGFLLEAGGTRVLVDPYLSERAERLYPPPLDPATLTGIDVLLCTHEHLDHLDVPTVRAVTAPSPRAVGVGPAPVTDQVVAAGGPADRVTAAVAHEPLSGLPVPV